MLEEYDESINKTLWKVGLHLELGSTLKTMWGTARKHKRNPWQLFQKERTST